MPGISSTSPSRSSSASPAPSSPSLAPSSTTEEDLSSVSRSRSPDRPGRTSTPARRAPNSSATFLHHLHTHPNSHHISLSGPFPRAASSALSASLPPASEAQPSAGQTRSDGAGISGSGTRPDHSRASSSASTSSSTAAPAAAVGVVSSSKPKNVSIMSESSNIAGPSSAPPLRRAGSRRTRPQTTPVRSPLERPPAFGAGTTTSVQTPSPEMDVTMKLEDQPFIPAQDDWDQPSLRARAVETPESVSMQSSASNPRRSSGGISAAMGLMNIGDDACEEPTTRVVGRAGPSPQQPPPPSPPVPAQENPRRGESVPVKTVMVSVPPRESPPTLSWKTFAESYADGRFDPNRIPLPPVPVASSQARTAHSSPGAGTGAAPYPAFYPRPSEAGTTSSFSGSDSGPFSQTSGSSGGSGSTFTTVSSAPITSENPDGTTKIIQPTQPTAASGGMAAAIAARKKAFELESLDQKKTEPQPPRPDALALPSYSLAAATVRMASSGFQHSTLSPLGVPSPERELLDPMSIVISPASRDAIPSASSDPGGQRFPLSRSMSSTMPAWDREALHLPTIAASPVGTPLERPASSGTAAHPHHLPMPTELPRRSTSPPATMRTSLGGIVNQRIPPATAPIEKTVETENEGDYFGSAVSPKFDRQTSYNSQSSSNNTVTQTATPLPKGKEPDSKSDRAPSPEPVEVLPPALPSPPALALPSEIAALYERYGWLPAPVPVNEAARRKALYRFNILHTSPDVNFDRIAHMAKLVFNTKIVLIALIDAEIQWHKSETGFGAEEASRISSFCSHTLLVTSGEPLVILDTTQDWRFANLPQVLGKPHVRFYAGAPLRTADGYNLGSLCIIDDKPRMEFPPRSRLILKEFAAVTMREMELWRDKLQLRVRDKIQTSMEKFTRECLEMDARSTASKAEASARMDQVYSRAAQLVCSTLDMDGCFILDLSQFESVSVNTEHGKQTIFKADPYSSETPDSVLEMSGTFGAVNPFPILAALPPGPQTRSLTPEEHQKMSDFLLHHRDGRIFENIAPSWIRYMFPPDLRYGMVVPCFGINQQPFALITAYTCNKAKQYLEGYELQFLRAIGVIILSAVLRRRMVLADKTKSVLISSVSHELRTPLHGILAAAELLSDTNLDSNQQSFLKTVQTCGNTLIETVNHVLDFTKLSGSSGASDKSTVKLNRVNLANLVEQTIEGVWIGQRARFFMGDADIGSFYAPPPSSAGVGISAHERALKMAKDLAHVETVIEIGHREKGWMVRCERGGLRRVLMNLVGNSLKFTKTGYVHITLKELPHPPGSKFIPVEMAVIDTGKGIGREFLKDQLFQPFSQENPLQTGTGLGLAIVNSIIRSESVNGKVDVSSVEGEGTEIRVAFDVEVFDDDEEVSSNSASSVVSTTSSFGRGHSIAFIGFDPKHRGNVLGLEVLRLYAEDWMFDQHDSGDISVINEDESLLRFAQDGTKAIIFYTSAQSPAIMGVRDSINRAGGHCQVIHKPIGPTAFRQALHRAVGWLDNRDRDGDVTPLSEKDRPPMLREDSGASAESGDSTSTISELSHRRNLSSQIGDNDSATRQPLLRRRSEEQEQSMLSQRPSMAPRGVTYHAPNLVARTRKQSMSDDNADSPGNSDSPQLSSPNSTTSHFSTISLADGGVMLKTAQLPPTAPRPVTKARVMVVEDNIINRRVLGAFLKKKGFEYHEAHDGQEGVTLFNDTPPSYWDVILMDISMPNMNGHEATRAIRKIEKTRRSGRPAETPPIPEPGEPILIPSPAIVQNRAKIFALTGLATADDKREAFGSGVDG